MMAKKFLKKILPKSVLNGKHLFYAWYGALKYHHPSESLFVIGITGTSGKSSTTYFLRQILEGAGFKVGSLSTIDFYIAGEEKLNDQKMTMLGKMQIQKYLRDMVHKNCDIAIVETTSEGAVQFRHKFICYDMIVLTNLYPEHIESHGSFKNYKGAKLSIFKYIATSARKSVQGTQRLWTGAQPLSEKMQKIFSGLIPKIAVMNGDVEYAQEFLHYPFDEKILFESKGANSVSDKNGLHFMWNGTAFHAPLFGEHNIMNILAALSIAKRLGVSESLMKSLVASLKGPEGRLEFILEAKQKGFDVIVDYAFEPVAMQKLYDVVKLLAPRRVIHVFGGTGGGRDIARRFTVGEFVGKNADVCIVTDEDPYDDNPQTIIDDVASAVIKAGKVEGKNVFKILDREKAIQKAIQLAEAGDLVLITGKGSEQGMVVKGKIIPWDDRRVVREALERVESEKSA